MATEKKKATRQSPKVRMNAILVAAREVFERQGYEKATVAEIADIVGVVEGTVFSYFSSKRILVLNVMEQFYEEVTALLSDGIKGVEGTRNQLHSVIWNHLNVVTKYASLCRVILRESRGLDEVLSKKVHDLNRQYTSVIGDVIQQGIANDEINPDTSPTLIRTTIFGSIEHYLWDSVDGDGNVDTNKTAQQLTDLIYNGIASSNSDVNKREVNSLIKKLNKML
jgi:TetR/AcrR family transcriptional regulator, fatty acid metabolism regulator protein